MAQATHDLTIKTGEYTDSNGDTKGRYLRIGTVFRHDDGGTSIKLDCVPVGLPEWNGWVNVYPKQERKQQGHQAQHQAAPPQQPAQQFNDDIPF